MAFVLRFVPATAAAVVLVVVAAVAGLIRAADHNDGNGTFGGWDLAGRRDANITNFFAFRSADNLVLIALMNAGITDPDYFFAEDLTLTFHIDHNSAVTFGDAAPPVDTDDWMMRFGGTVTNVDKISADVTVEVSFAADANGGSNPRLRVEGRPASALKHVRVFPAPDESPVRGSNAAVVLELPLSLVVDADAPGNSLLLWVTSKIPEIHGPISDHMGMPNTSNQRDNLLVNHLRPRDQAPFLLARPRDLPAEIHLAPYADVLIYDLSRDSNGFPPGGVGPIRPFDPLNPTAFPNGRPVDAALRLEPFLFPYIRR